MGPHRGIHFSFSVKAHFNWIIYRKLNKHKCLVFCLFLKDLQITPHIVYRRMLAEGLVTQDPTETPRSHYVNLNGQTCNRKCLFDILNLGEDAAS